MLLLHLIADMMLDEATEMQFDLMVMFAEE
jgi:hypothetical protein